MGIKSILPEWTRENGSVMRNLIIVEDRDGNETKFIIRLSDSAQGSINGLFPGIPHGMTEHMWNDFFCSPKVAELIAGFGYGNYEDGVEILEVKEINIATLINAYKANKQ